MDDDIIDELDSDDAVIGDEEEEDELGVPKVPGQDTENEEGDSEI